MSITLINLGQHLALETRGNDDLVFKGVASLKSAVDSDLCFIQHKKYFKELDSSNCGGVIVPLNFNSTATNKALIFSPNPQLSFVKTITEVFNQDKTLSSEINVSAQISSSAKIGENVTIGPLVVIGDDAIIGKNSVIEAGCIIGPNSKMGTACHLHARVTMENNCQIGNNVILHPGVVIGSDGFGLVIDDGIWHKIPQIGRVIIGNDVEIGANTTIDRGALDDTIIEDGCKLDNQIQVAHNVRIGAGTAIAACVGIAGSATIGKSCRISGAAVVLGHLSICDDVTITAMSLVTKDIKTPGTFSSGTPLMENSIWHRNNVRYKSLDSMAKKLAELEKMNNKR